MKKVDARVAWNATCNCPHCASYSLDCRSARVIDDKITKIIGLSEFYRCEKCGARWHYNYKFVSCMVEEKKDAKKALKDITKKMQETIDRSEGKQSKY